MPDKRTTTIIEEPPLPPDNAPNLVAYRVGQLEEAVKTGFKEHNEKLDALVNNFATKEELGAIQKRLDNYTWYWRAIILAVLTALATAVGALIATHHK